VGRPYCTERELNVDNEEPDWASDSGDQSAGTRL